MQITDVNAQTKAMIDDLKAVCANYGLGNSGNEYKIITEAFLYKFLNDKFIYEARRIVHQYAGKTSAEIEAAMSALSEDDYELMLLDFGAATARLKREHYISYIFNRQNEEVFHTLFDNTLVDISNYNVDIFSVKAGGQAKISLFDKLSLYVIQEERKTGSAVLSLQSLLDAALTAFLSRSMTFFHRFLNILSATITRTPENTANITRRTQSPASLPKLWCRTAQRM